MRDDSSECVKKLKRYYPKTNKIKVDGVPYADLSSIIKL